MKKWIAAISAAVLAVTGMASAIPAATVTAADSKYNYGEALQKSMFFYEVQQSGKKPDWNEVSWRSDCMTNDYVTGGWFDAGDHLKFTLTNAYSAALLGWGLLNYGDGVEKAGQRTMYENNLQFALDYLVGCDQGDNIVYMIGDGSFDHVWWGSAEVYMDKYELMKGETERPYYTCEDSCIQADMAAALCTGYLNFKDSKPEKAKEYLGKICSSGNLLMTIINQILEIARIESGTTALQLKAEDINTLFHTVNTVFEEDVRKKNLQYSVDLDVYHTFILCDRVKLQEIMLNIISNAIKYTSDGHGVHVKIYEKDSEDPRKVRFIFTCEDTGIGMSEEYLPHIFEEFTRERTSTESHVTGTGLGLPIVKALVDLMGGTINVESKVGQGTKTTIVLSFPTATEEQIQSRKEEQSGQILRNFKGKRILLAEDNELNAEIAMELLGESGLETEHVTDGIKCVETLKAKPEDYYDLILMDIQMPHMDGYEATKIIRALNDPRSRIPIIAMTANAFEEDRQRAFEAGMDAHIAKPIDVKILFSTLAQVLGEE